MRLQRVGHGTDKKEHKSFERESLGKLKTWKNGFQVGYSFNTRFIFLCYIAIFAFVSVGMIASENCLAMAVGRATT
jgi:hypothetical protein